VVSRARILSGVDEAGRGCLAGPVVAAAVILPEDDILPGLTDSKRLTPSQREGLEHRIKALARSLQEDSSYQKLIVIIGIMADKAARPMLRAILPLAHHIIFTRPVYDRAMDPGLLRDQAGHLSIGHQVIHSLPQALETAKAAAGPEDLILVTGSLFTVGEALSHLDPVSWPPDPI